MYPVAPVTRQSGPLSRTSPVMGSSVPRVGVPLVIPSTASAVVDAPEGHRRAIG